MSELPEKQVKRLRSLIQEAETNLAAAKELLISIIGDDGSVVTPRNSQEDVSGKIIEGVFDGQVMIGPDGKSYPVPANYASKSKLVEGDILKLTIADDGGFIYKQIGPIPRRQIIGTLVQHDGAYYVETNGREYRNFLLSIFVVILPYIYQGLLPLSTMTNRPMLAMCLMTSPMTASLNCRHSSKLSYQTYSPAACTISCHLLSQRGHFLICLKR